MLNNSKQYPVDSRQTNNRKKKILTTNYSLPTTNSGFTLIELLVAVAIIAVLSVIGVASYSGIAKKTADAKRLADIQAISKAYESNYDYQTKKYSPLQTNNFTSGSIPTDPAGKPYFNIIADDGSWYKTCATLAGNTEQFCNNNYSACVCNEPIQNKTTFSGPFSGDGFEIGVGPISTSGLKLWLKADAITGLADDAALGNWNDSSSVNNHFTQIDPARMPKYKVSGIGGKPAVRFDGGDLLVRSLDPSGTGMSVFAVVNTGPTAVNYETIFANNQPLPPATRWAFTIGTDVTWGLGWGGVGSIGLGSGVATANTNYLLSWVNSKPNWKTYRNSVLISSPNDSTFPANPFLGRIGAENDTLGYPFNGDIAEIIVYDHAVTNSERDAVESYLRSKYGL